MPPSGPPPGAGDPPSRDALRGVTFKTLPDGRVRIRMRLPNGPRKSRTCHDDLSARREAARWLAERDLGRSIGGEASRLANSDLDGAICALLADSSAGASKRWVKNVTDVWPRHVSPYPLAQVGISELTTEQLARHLRLLRSQGAKPPTLRKVQGFVRKVVEYAITHGLRAEQLGVIPIPDESSKKEPAFVSALTPLFTETVCCFLTRVEDRMFTRFLQYSGGRPAEVRAYEVASLRPHALEILVLRSIDLDGELTWVKNQRLHLASVAPTFMDLAADFARERSGYLFPGPEGKVSMTDDDYKNYRLRYERAATLAVLAAEGRPREHRQSVKPPTPYDHRSGYASMHFHAGATVSEVASWLGDSEETVRRHYLRLRIDDAARLAVDEQIRQARAAVTLDPPVVRWASGGRGRSDTRGVPQWP